MTAVFDCLLRVKFSLRDVTRLVCEGAGGGDVSWIVFYELHSLWEKVTGLVREGAGEGDFIFG